MISRRKSLHLAFVAACAGSAALSWAAGGVANLPVSAIVRPSTVLKFEGGSIELRVSTADIARGYVDVPTHAQITILSGKDVKHVVNVSVDFEPHPDILKSIQVSARHGAKGDGTAEGNGSSTSLAYRLFLAGKATSRNFSVPLTLSVQL
jgi:hypothetical protein